ncbi:MAG TPA: cytochrome P450 [Polyangiales bacterium]|nr:cytochrome P450 [Polyangiales bacterium]
MSRSLASLPGPPRLPLLGNAHQLDPRQLHRQLEAWQQQYGNAFVVRLGKKPLLVLAETEHVQRVLQERPDTFRRFSPIETVTREIEGYGLFSAEGDDWRRMRKLVLPGFSLRQLRDFHPDLVRITQRLGRSWQAAASRRQAVDPLDALKRYTVDVTSQVAFGRDLNTLERPDSDLQAHLACLFAAINQRINAVFPHWRYLKLPRDYRIERSKRRVREVMFEMIHEAEALLRCEPARAAAPRTLLEAMLAARDSTDPASRMSDDEVAANVATFLLAGEDTTANTLGWALHYLAHRPEIRQRAQLEADAVLGDAELATTFEDISRLRYITAIVHETLRLRAVLPVQFMEARSDVALGDLQVPAGTALFLLTRRCAMQPSNFTDPERFEPERWLSPAEAGLCPGRAHNARASFAFGGGQRTCPGRALALVECALVLSMVLRKFEIRADYDEASVTESFDFTMQPVGVRLRFAARGGDVHTRRQRSGVAEGARS